MKALLLNKITFRILIIEDDPAWYENMRYFLERWAKKLEIMVSIELAKDGQTARQLMGKKLFHTVAVDLRLPEKPSGPLGSQARGIDLAIVQSQTMPLVWEHIFTAYAQEYALELYRQNSEKKLLPPPIWEKASSDNEGPDCYTQEQWAQRILAGLLPLSAVLKIPLVNERTELKQKLTEDFSCLGESMDFAMTAGCHHLPPGIAHSFAVIHRFLQRREKEHELPAFQEALFLAETVQHWLWVQAAAWLTAMNRPEKLVWPLQTNGNRPNRGSMEASLATMCHTMAQLHSSPTAETWLSHLHLSADSNEMSIIDALRYIRAMRNNHHHTTAVETLPWEALAIPLRMIVDACSFLASYPILSQPKPAPDGRWRFTLLKGETTPLPEAEWTLSAGVLGENQRFAPTPEDQTLYQLWPCPDNTLGLLKLWPFAEQRVTADEGRTAWLLAGQGRHQRFWEQSALDGRNQCKEISGERFRYLEKLGLLKDS